MSRNFWFAFEWGAYEDKTAHLSFAEHGAYLKLMIHYYKTRRALDANAAVLHRVCSASNESEKAAVSTVLQQFFVRQNGGYIHPRIEEELAKSLDISTKRASAATNRWAANAVQKHMHLDTQLQSQLHKPKVKSKNIRTQFQIPPIEDVSAECKTRGNSVDPKHFHSYYTANGWRVGKNPMRNWKAALTTWERNGFTQPAAWRPGDGSVPHAKCTKHPKSGRTETGGCYGCYEEKYSTDQPRGVGAS